MVTVVNTQGIKKMKIEEVQKDITKERKVVPLNIRVTPSISKWLKEKNISPTAMFIEGLKELGCPYIKQ